MDPTALPGRPGQHLADGGLQPFVRIADDQLHALQPPLDQAAQKFAPERFALAGAQGQAQHVALARFAHADGNHGRQTDDAVVLPHLQVDRIQPDVRVALRQRPVTELRDQAHPAPCRSAKPGSCRCPASPAPAPGHPPCACSPLRCTPAASQPAAPFRCAAAAPTNWESSCRAAASESASSIRPTRVSQGRSRLPLRWFVRSALRWYFAAPICCVTSRSIAICANNASPSRRKSPSRLRADLAQILAQCHTWLSHRVASFRCCAIPSGSTR